MYIAQSFITCITSIKASFQIFEALSDSSKFTNQHYDFQVMPVFWCRPTHATKNHHHRVDTCDTKEETARTVLRTALTDVIDLVPHTAALYKL